MSDSYAPILVDILVRGADGEEVVIRSSDHFVSLSVESKAASSWTGSLVMFDEEGDYLENLLLASGSDRVIKFRWTWDEGRGLDDAPWYAGGVTNVTPSFSTQGVTLTLEMVSSSAYDAVVDERLRTFGANTKASDIVSTIAKSRGWRTQSSGSPTVETTDSPRVDPSNFTDMNDLQILDELARTTVNQNGDHYFWFFDPNGAIHFHSRGFLGNAIAASYNFARDAMGDVISFDPTDTSLAAHVLGAGNSIMRSTDSYRGVRLDSRYTTDTPAEGARNVVVPDEAHRTTHGSGRAGTGAMEARDSDTFLRQLQARRSRLLDGYVKADMVVRGSHFLWPLQRLQVQYYKRNGDQHYLSGNYQIEGVTHEVSSSSWTSTAALFRQGHRPTESSDQQEVDVEVPVVQANSPESAPKVDGSTPVRHTVRTSGQGSRGRRS